MDGWIILWYNRLYGTHEIEEFDSYEEAKAKLVEFSSEFPWNTYKLARDDRRSIG